MNKEVQFNDNDIDDMFDCNTLPKKQDTTQIIDEKDLHQYYEHLFPYEDYFKWFGANDSSFFEKREFSFTKKGDIYIRFLCFHNDIELKASMMKENPIKIDIGAVYNTLPKYRSTGGSTTFLPVQKELVFDIDMTDYDDVRTCCSEAKICNKCWKYLIIAFKVLDIALREDFDFKSIMWVFSGRRGVHCWVGDERARKLNNEGRSAIANYLSRKTVNKTTGLMSTIKEPLHPSIDRAYNIISEKFEEVALFDQDILNNIGIIEIVKIIFKSYLGNQRDYYNNNMETIFNEILNNKSLSSQVKWNKLNEEVERNKTNTYFKSAFKLAIMEIKFSIMYPRLDINVSKHINHLLKSPFCVHPKTGLISVPLDAETIENFDVKLIPSLKESLEDLKNNNRNSKFDKYMRIFKASISTFNVE